MTIQSVARKGVLGLGDSVLLGSRPLFAAHGWRVDARVSRQFSMGVSILRRYGIHPNASGLRQYMGLIESAVARWGI